MISPCQESCYRGKRGGMFSSPLRRDFLFTPQERAGTRSLHVDAGSIPYYSAEEKSEIMPTLWSWKHIVMVFWRVSFEFNILNTYFSGNAFFCHCWALLECGHIWFWLSSSQSWYFSTLLLLVKCIKLENRAMSWPVRKLSTSLSKPLCSRGGQVGYETTDISVTWLPRR